MSYIKDIIQILTLQEKLSICSLVSSALLNTTSGGLFLVSILTSPGCVWNCDQLMCKRLVSARDTLTFLHKLHCFGWFQERRSLRGKKKTIRCDTWKAEGVFFKPAVSKVPEQTLKPGALQFHQRQDWNLFPPFTALSSDGNRWSDCLGGCWLGVTQPCPSLQTPADALTCALTQTTGVIMHA